MDAVHACAAAPLPCVSCALLFRSAGVTSTALVSWPDSVSLASSVRSDTQCLMMHYTQESMQRPWHGRTNESHGFFKWLRHTAYRIVRVLRLAHKHHHFTHVDHARVVTHTHHLAGACM